MRFLNFGRTREEIEERDAAKTILAGLEMNPEGVIELEVDSPEVGKRIMLYVQGLCTVKTARYQDVRKRVTIKWKSWGPGPGGVGL